MNGIVLGVAMLVLSAGESPAAETSRVAVAPTAFNYELPDTAASSSNLRHSVLNEQSRFVRRRGALAPAKATAPKRFNKTDRVIAVAAGVCLGWIGGGIIGFAATSKPNDDVSGLKGMIIGAPIGSAVGAVLGYRLTR